MTAADASTWVLAEHLHATFLTDDHSHVKGPHSSPEFRFCGDRRPAEIGWGLIERSLHQRPQGSVLAL